MPDESLYCRLMYFNFLPAQNQFSNISFFSQVHVTLPRVVFHVKDEALLVSQTCKVKRMPKVCST